MKKNEGGEGFVRVGFTEAIACLSAGRPLIFPTDTVVGLGVSILHAPNPQELYALKGRDDHKPIAWLIPSKESLATFGRDVPPYAYALAEAFWPGPVTLIVKASEHVPGAFMPKTRTIGLRMPASSVACELARQVGSPLATTSANRSGQVAPQDIEHLDTSLAAQVAVLHDAPEIPEIQERGQSAHTLNHGICVSSGTASTIVDCTGALPCIIRAGDITPSDIELAYRKRG